MPETLLIDGKPVEVDGKAAPGNVVVLTVKYRGEILIQPEAARRLSEAFLKVYRDTLGAFNLKAAPCVVVIQSDKGASALVRAFYDLYQEVVEARGCKLAVAGYPEAYIDEILTTGIPQLGGFFLTNKESEALELVR
jgi:hypothetical protein